MAIFVPPRESATTHCTDGLSGFPAIDFPGALGEPVRFEEQIVVSDPHLITWKRGYGGWTFYAHGESGATYFVTHLDETQPTEPGTYQPGAIVGYLTRSPRHARLINGAHVHVGNTSWPNPPGQNCGIPPGSIVGGGGNVVITRTGGTDTRRAIVVGAPSSTAADTHLTRAWHSLTRTTSHTLRRSTHAANRASRQYKVVAGRLGKR